MFPLTPQRVAYRAGDPPSATPSRRSYFMDVGWASPATATGQRLAAPQRSSVAAVRAALGMADDADASDRGLAADGFARTPPSWAVRPESLQTDRSLSDPYFHLRSPATPRLYSAANLDSILRLADLSRAERSAGPSGLVDDLSESGALRERVTTLEQELRFNRGERKFFNHRGEHLAPVGKLFGSAAYQHYLATPLLRQYFRRWLLLVRLMRQGPAGRPRRAPSPQAPLHIAAPIQSPVNTGYGYGYGDSAPAAMVPTRSPSGGYGSPSSPAPRRGPSRGFASLVSPRLDDVEALARGAPDALVDAATADEMRFYESVEALHSQVRGLSAARDDHAAVITTLFEHVVSGDYRLEAAEEAGTAAASMARAASAQSQQSASALRAVTAFQERALRLLQQHEQTITDKLENARQGADGSHAAEQAALAGRDASLRRERAALEARLSESQGRQQDLEAQLHAMRAASASPVRSPHRGPAEAESEEHHYRALHEMAERLARVEMERTRDAVWHAQASGAALRQHEEEHRRWVTRAAAEAAAEAERREAEARSADLRRSRQVDLLHRQLRQQLEAMEAHTRAVGAAAEEAAARAALREYEVAERQTSASLASQRARERSRQTLLRGLRTVEEQETSARLRLRGEASTMALNILTAAAEEASLLDPVFVAH